MSRHAANVWTFCAILLFGGCTSAPEPAPEPKEEKLYIPTSQAPPRPEYHAESDAVSFGTRETRELTTAACAVVEDPKACREAIGRKIHGYRGSFSAPGADEALVALPNTAVLLARTGGGWRTRSQAQEVDINHCLLRSESSADRPNDLLCRAAASGDRGFGLAFFSLSAAEDGQLEVRPLDTPRASDVDTSLFAGWKNEDDLIELRFHKETAVKGTSTLNFDGRSTCAYRTFGYRPDAQPALVEIEGCKGSTGASGDELTPSHSTRTDSQYENRLHDPIQAHNREYVMCYHHELERLKAEAEKAQAEAEAAEEAEKSKRTNKRTKKSAESDGSDEAEEPAEPISGEIKVRFVIGSSGAPVSCEVARSTMQNENVEACLCREIMNTPFPPVPTGKFVDVTYPFNFTPAEE